MHTVRLVRATPQAAHRPATAGLRNFSHINFFTAALGAASLAFLFWVRGSLKPLLQSFGLGERAADLLAKAGPVAAIVATTLTAWSLGLAGHGVSIVGTVPQGLPRLTLPRFDLPLWTRILAPALLISIVGYVESISVALTL